MTRDFWEGYVPEPQYSVNCVNHDCDKCKAAAQPAPVQDEHQAFIDSLPTDSDDKMYMQIHHWARQSYKRHQSLVRGQMITAADASDTHIIWAALRWAKEKTPPALPAPVQEPVAWMHTMIDDVVVGHRPADLNVHPDRWMPLYKDPTPCQTCQALARTVMMDQTAHDTTPPAARPAVPDAFGTREGEHPQYIQGWNDCRAEMLRGMKP